MSIVLVFERPGGQSGCVRVSRFREPHARRLLTRLGYTIIAKVT